MEKNYKTLGKMLELFGAESFYSIEATNFDVKLQGYTNKDVAIKALENGFEQSTSERGYLHFDKGNCRLILT